MVNYNVKLNTMTDNAVDTCALAALTCRNGGNFDELIEVVEEEMEHEEKVELVRKCIRMGHLSIIEHIQFTFLIDNISRSCSHQLVRSRLSTCSQESQRTVNPTNMKPIVPEGIKDNPEAMELFDFAMESAKDVYTTLTDIGILPEDARSVLPNATPTKMVMSFNARELYHLFDLRLCLCAQDEIRNVVNQMRILAMQELPELFWEEMIGPDCMRSGKCPQNNHRCRRYQEIIKDGHAIREPF